jgi:hypothetical protein
MEPTIMAISQQDPARAQALIQQGQIKQTESGIRYLIINQKSNETGK